VSVGIGDGLTVSVIGSVSTAVGDGPGVAVDGSVSVGTGLSVDGSVSVGTELSVDGSMPVGAELSVDGSMPVGAGFSVDGRVPVDAGAPVGSRKVPDMDVSAATDIVAWVATSLASPAACETGVMLRTRATPRQSRTARAKLPPTAIPTPKVYRLCLFMIFYGPLLSWFDGELELWGGGLQVHLLGQGWSATPTLPKRLSI